MKFYTIDPDVPGRTHGETIRAFRSGHHPENVRYIFECWPEADVVQTFPIFLVSEKLALALRSAKLTGFELKACESSKGDQFHIASPGYGELPKYFWLDVNGKSEQDDFGISNDLMLRISERVYDLLQNFCVEGAEIDPV